MRVLGEVKEAQYENLAADPTGVGLVPGRFWYRTDTDKFRVYDGTTVREFADLSSTQTFINKTFTSPSITTPTITSPTVNGPFDMDEQGSTPSDPAANRHKFYFKDDGKLYTLDENGVEEEVGSGAGSGGINYITNPDAENNLDGWDTYADLAGNQPVDGIGGAPTTILFRLAVSSNVLRGGASFSLQKDGANRQGEGTSSDFTIDEADKFKPITIIHDYRFPSGSGISDDVKIFIYDIDNAQLITPSGDNGVKVTELTNSRTMTLQFAATDSLNYRLIYHIASTNAVVWNLFFDRVSVGPDVLVPGAIITDWQSETAVFDTGLTVGNATENIIEWRRVGNVMEARGNLIWGSTTSSSGFTTLNIPNGELIDDQNLTPGSAQVFGKAQHQNTGTAIVDGLVIQSTASRVVLRYWANNTSTGDQQADLSAGAPFTWTTGDIMYYEFKVPIQGWSAGALLSTTEALFSTANARVSSGTSQTGNPITTDIKVEHTVVDFDPLGMFDAANFEFIIPRDGVYLINAHNAYSLGTASTTWSIKIQVNGSAVAQDAKRSNANATYQLGITTLQDLKKGDLVSSVGRNAVGANWTLGSGSVNTFLEISEQPDFSTFSIFGEREFIDAESASVTATSSGAHVPLTGNGTPLTPGVWALNALGRFTRTGGTADATIMNFSWSELANSYQFTGTSSGITLQAGNAQFDGARLDFLVTPQTSRFSASLPTIRVLVTENTTVYVNAFLAAVNFANYDAKVHIYAERIS